MDVVKKEFESVKARQSDRMKSVSDGMKSCVPEKLAGKLEKEVKKLVRERVRTELSIKAKEQVRVCT
jgi:hypothetical protein